MRWKNVIQRSIPVIYLTENIDLRLLMDGIFYQGGRLCAALKKVSFLVQNAPCIF